MSDTPAPQEGAPAAGTETPPPAAEAAPEAAAPTDEAPVEYDLLDLDALDGKHIRIKADGEEKVVPAREALSSYQQEAAWTRKSQELAEQRREAEMALQLQQAMQVNPGMTVQILAQAAGVSVEEFLGMTPQQQQAAVDAGPQQQDEDQYTDPLEAEIAKVNQQLQALQAERATEAATRELEQIIGGLKAQFQADDNDLRAVVQEAWEKQLPPQMIPVLYRSQQFEKLRTQEQTTQEWGQERQQQEAQRQAQAAQAAVTQGAGASAANLQGTVPTQNMSLHEAIASGIQAGRR